MPVITVLALTRFETSASYMLLNPNESGVVSQREKVTLFDSAPTVIPSLCHLQSPIAVCGIVTR